MRRVLPIAVVALAVPATALARSQPPQIACWQIDESTFDTLAQPDACTVIAPRGERSPRRSELTRLSQLDWSDWGSRTATATATVTTYRDNGSSMTRRGTVSVYALAQPGRREDCPTHRRAYTRMRVTSGGDSSVFDIARVVGRCGDART